MSVSPSTGLPQPHVHLLPPPLSLALDARLAGTEAHFATNGCRPNAVLRPVLCAPSKGGQRERDEGYENGKPPTAKKKPSSEGEQREEDVEMSVEVETEYDPTMPPPPPPVPPWASTTAAASSSTMPAAMTNGVNSSSSSSSSSPPNLTHLNPNTNSNSENSKEPVHNNSSANQNEANDKHAPKPIPEPQSSFALFALRDLKASEEIVLGWEWDDGSVVHEVPALIEMYCGLGSSAVNGTRRKYVFNLLLTYCIHSLFSFPYHLPFSV